MKRTTPAPTTRPMTVARLSHPDYVADLPVWHHAHDEQIAHMITTHVAEVNAQRQALEDERSIKRNRNRLLTLLGALVISFVITYVLRGGYLGSAGVTLAPYSFAITILLDSSFSFYAYLRRY